MILMIAKMDKLKEFGLESCELNPPFTFERCGHWMRPDTIPLVYD
jgi:hypothetical protein